MVDKKEPDTCQISKKYVDMNKLDKYIKSALKKSKTGRIMIDMYDLKEYLKEDFKKFYHHFPINYSFMIYMAIECLGYKVDVYGSKLVIWT